MLPSGPIGTMALLEIVSPGLKLMVLTFGTALPAGPGYATRFPCDGGVTAARLITTAVAPEGMLHCPVRTMLRAVLEARAGPPYGPFELRVSTNRHEVVR